MVNNINDIKYSEENPDHISDISLLSLLDNAMVAPINVIVSYAAENVTNVTQFVCRKTRRFNSLYLI